MKPRPSREESRRVSKGTTTRTYRRPRHGEGKITLKWRSQPDKVDENWISISRSDGCHNAESDLEPRTELLFSTAKALRLSSLNKACNFAFTYYSPR